MGAARGLLTLCLGGLRLTPAVASPFDPHPAQRSGPFFDGWFTRIVDHERGVSAAVIIGSFQPARDGSFNSTWVALLHRGAGSNTTVVEQHFLDQSDVRVESRSLPEPGYVSNFTWRSTRGELEVNDSAALLSFAFDSLHVRARLSARVPWSAEAPDAAGPEGWVRRLPALTCHYYVHSLASRAEYTLTPAGGSAIEGRGHAHMEGNYGRTFPQGWIWLQAIGASGGVQVVLTAGRFLSLGPLGISAVVMAYRSPQLHWDFRTTDLDAICWRGSAAGGWFSAVARHWTRDEELRLTVQAPPGSFSDRLYFPTRSGFSDTPGCRESYSAVVDVVAYRRGVALERQRVPLAALEFGGTYLDSPESAEGSCALGTRPPERFFA
uniref:AttH domain-containing protein n=1 Tax=Alexandrium monilatum TaxID=311494 RepID=A0A7S4PYL0_9DINO